MLRPSLLLAVGALLFALGAPNAALSDCEGYCPTNCNGFPGTPIPLTLGLPTGVDSALLTEGYAYCVNYPDGWNYTYHPLHVVEPLILTFEAQYSNAFGGATFQFRLGESVLFETPQNSAWGSYPPPPIGTFLDSKTVQLCPGDYDFIIRETSMGQHTFQECCEHGMLNNSVKFKISAERPAGSILAPPDERITARVSPVGSPLPVQSALLTQPAVAPVSARGDAYEFFALGLKAKPGEAGSVDLYDLRGARVWQSPVRVGSDGSASARWNGVLADGANAKPGVYFYRMAVGGQVKRGRLIRVPGGFIGEVRPLDSGMAQIDPLNSGVLDDGDDGGGGSGGGGNLPDPSNWYEFLDRIWPYVSVLGNGTYAFNETAARAARNSERVISDAKSFIHALNLALAGDQNTLSQVYDYLTGEWGPPPAQIRHGCGDAWNYDPDKCPHKKCARDVGFAGTGYFLTKADVEAFLRDEGFHPVDTPGATEGVDDWARPVGAYPIWYPNCDLEPRVFNGRTYKPFRWEAGILRCCETQWTFWFQGEPAEPDPEYALLWWRSNKMNARAVDWMGYVGWFHLVKCNPGVDNAPCCPQ